MSQLQAWGGNQTTRRLFVFVPHDGKQNSAKSDLLRQANRHVQLTRAANASNGPKAPARQQIRFRISRTKNQECLKYTGRDKPKPRTSPEHVVARDGISIPRLINNEGGTHSDRSAVKYFADVVAIELSEEITNQFWQVLILQQVRQEPVLQCALTALSSIHRLVINDGFAQRDGGEAVKLTSIPSVASAAAKVVSGLRAYIQSPQMTYCTVISCAIILATIHDILGEADAVTFHMDNVFAVFNSWTQAANAIRSAQYNTIQNFLIRYDTGATARDLRRAPKLPTTPSSSLSQHQGPLRFDSVEQIDDHITRHIGHRLFTNRAEKGLHGQVASVAQKLLEIEESLLQWWVAADHFRRSSVVSAKDELGLLLIDAHYLASVCELAEALHEEIALPAVSWDFHLEHMLELGERAVEIQRKLRGDQLSVSTVNRSARHGKGIGEILFLFASKITLDEGRNNALRLVEEYSKF